jgi:ribosomal protein S18 acetylase RimI-like enzyme
VSEGLLERGSQRTLALAIRSARASDAEVMASLLGQLGYPASAEAVAARLARLEGPSQLVLVAETDRVVGLATLHVMATIEHDRPVARIGALVVDEAHRGLRLGEKLVQRLEAEARARDCCLLYVTSANPRCRAHSFYLRLGFEHTGLRFTRSFSAPA